MSRSLWPPSDLAGTVGLDGLPPLSADRVVCQENVL